MASDYIKNIILDEKNNKNKIIGVQNYERSFNFSGRT